VPRTEVYCCSTLLSLATALAWRAEPAGGPPEQPVRRVLLVSDYAAEAEVGTRLLQRDGAAALAAGFDLVVDVNELLAPYHPASFDPGRDAAVLLGRLLAAEWGAVGDVELVVEPIQVAFARWLLHLLPDAPVTVVADGLMAYGPTRDRVPHAIGRRITRLVHLDLVPGLRPVYLTEHAVPAETVSAHRLREVLDGALGEPVGAAPEGAAGVLVLGQYLSALGVLTPEEEQALYLDAVVQASAWAGGRVAFKPHPAASPLLSSGLREAAAAKGIDVEVLPASGPAETLFATGRYAVVAGCFSTGLFTASAVYGLRAVSVGTDLLLERLRPYQNSNRIPVVLADALLRQASERAHGEAVRPEDVGELVQAVAYCMQADRYPHLRLRAVATLGAHPRWRDRYVKRKRLRALGLGGGVEGSAPARSTSPTPAVRLAGQAVRRVLPARARRMLRRVRPSS
jgi:hypothetical protein